MNNFSFVFEQKEVLFLVVGVVISIPMIYLFAKAGRELLKEPPPNPPADQRKEP